MTTRLRTRLKSAIALTGAGAIAVLTLSGCISMTANLSIDSDAQTTGTFAIGLQKQAATMFGMKDLDTFASGIKSPEMSSGAGDLLSADDCAATETDAEFVYTCTLTDADLSADDNPFAVTKDGNTITFSMENPATADNPASDLLQGGSLGTLVVNVSFPGEITSITGDNVTKTSDTSVAIEAALTDAVNVTVTSDASGAGGKYSRLLVVILIIAAALGVAAFFVFRHFHHDAAPVAAAAPEEITSA